MKAITIILLIATLASAQAGDGDVESLIEAILLAEAEQRATIIDITFDAEFHEGERNDDGVFTEKFRFDKTIYLKNLPDTTLFAEHYLRAIKEGEELDSSKAANEFKDRIEKKKKRGGKDIATRWIKPFMPEFRERYEIEYVGLEDELLEELLCHHFRVTALEKDPDLINGDFYFETETFHLARLDFSPAKLGGNMWFKIKRLDMTLICGPIDDGYWLPRRFDLTGKGKATLFIGVKFAGTEYYRNPRLNTGLSDELFEVDNGGE